MKGYTQLTYEERIKIGLLSQQGYTPTEIAGEIGRHRSTIYRELGRNKHAAGYFPQTAEILSNTRKQEASSIDRVDEEIKDKALEMLKKHQWSPEQICNRMKMETGKSVSHEWIYQMIYEDRKEGGNLHFHLRWGRRKRKKRFGGRDKRGQIPNRVSIEKRPKIINKRSRIGDFEGDTVIGKNHKGKLLTLVDRTSRLSIIEKLKSKSAEETAATIIESVNSRESVFMSFTFDNGKEFSGHEKITQETKVPVFFAHPYSSYERGTNENTNGLIRQYFPKDCDLSQIPESKIKTVENLLNHRPRKVLGYKTPYEVHFKKEVQYFSSVT